MGSLSADGDVPESRSISSSSVKVLSEVGRVSDATTCVREKCLRDMSSGQSAAVAYELLNRLPCRDLGQRALAQDRSRRLSSTSSRAEHIDGIG